MDTLFSACFLVQDGANNPELKTAPVNLQPGSTLSLDPDEGNILLAGGFASISPENRFPLSSTLQLNSDLGSFDQGQLTAIAQAELGRKNDLDYRSYTQEADPRVCVIADSAPLLNQFIDTYGGVLEIEPLLAKGVDPEIPTATELNLETREGKCLLEYQVRSPIDFDKCSYCGACGRVCPEQCISEALFVDFERCTLCRECEKTCGPGAIDIHGALRKSLEVPAIILLGSLEVDLPEKIENVYREEQLADYFSTLFPCQVDEVVSSNPTLCQYSAELGAGCDLCLSSCRYGAITQDGRGVTVDAFKCEECGGCLSACPTGALQYERFRDDSFVRFFQETAPPLDGTVVIGDESCLHRLWWHSQGKRYQNLLFVHYPQVEALSLFHLLFLLSRGVRRIVLLQPEKGWSVNSAAEKQLALLAEIVSGLYDIDDAVTRCTIEDFADHLSGLGGGSLGCQVPQPTFVNRRQSLRESLAGLVVASDREITLRPEIYQPFATVCCDRDKCTQCLACLGKCRIEAMRADEQQLSLNHLAALCVGCGLCVRVCPEEALTIRREFTLNKTFFQPVEMAKAEPMACKSCGKVFGTKKSYERVMAILSKKEAVDTSHFEYCETCRVVKLFEAE